MNRDFFEKMQNSEFVGYFMEYMIKHCNEVNTENKDCVFFRLAVIVSFTGLYFGVFDMLLGIMMFAPMALLLGLVLTTGGLFSLGYLYGAKSAEKEAFAYAERRMKENGRKNER